MNETVNCLTIRRTLLSDPYRQSEAVRRHIQDCPQCRNFSLTVYEMNSDIETVLNVDTPAGLTDKILLAKGVNNNREQKRTQQRMITAFAGLMLILSSLTIYFYRDEPLSIEMIALSHVQGEPHHLEDRKNIQLSQLNDILQNFSVKLTNTSNIINYAGTCEINHSRGAHVVFQGEHAPITMLLLPNDTTLDRKDIMGTRFKGVILPFQNGSMALIADKIENLSLFERQITQQLTVI